MATTKIDLTLSVPNLHGVGPAELPMPVLQRMLSRAKQGRAGQGDDERVLFALFNILIPKDAELPVAAITYALDSGEYPTSALMRADPIHCQAGNDQIVMMASSLDLDMQEAQQMVAELNKLFAEDDWEFIALTPQRWYLRMPQIDQFSSTPLSHVMGQNIHPYLPQHSGVSSLHRSLAEIEMLLHGNFSNQQRPANDQLPVTGLWLWGAGELPQKPVVDFSQVWSGDALALGLAKFAGIPRCDKPEDATSWLQQLSTPGHHFITLPDIEDPMAFEQQWLEPLNNAIVQGQLNSLQLLPGNGRYYQINKRSQRRWWRRSKTLKSLL